MSKNAAGRVPCETPSSQSGLASAASREKASWTRDSSTPDRAPGRGTTPSARQRAL